MKTTGKLKALFFYVVPAIFFAGLLIAAASNPTPAPPKANAPSSKKPPKFPMNLFAEAQEGDFSNDKTCTSCHRTSVESFGRSPHAVFMKDPKSTDDKHGCQACHGPGTRHVAHRKTEDGLYTNVISYTRAKPEEISAACLRCHGDTITESHWKLAAHSKAGVSCTTCHQIHQADRLGVNQIHRNSPDDKVDGADSIPRVETTRKSESARAQLFNNAADPKAMLKGDEPTLCGSCHRSQMAEFRHNFHHPVPEGRMVCSDCHDVHSNRDGRKQMRTAKQSCITCHAEVAGPFVYEHDPVSDLSGDGCLECHRAHGSSNPKLLNAFSRGLCTQCHADKSVNHHPGRSCFDSGCHSAVHGSNHDPLLLRR